MVYAGLDIGSVSIKFVILDGSLNPLEKIYLRHQGDPFSLTLSLLRDYLDKYGKFSLSITGNGSKFINEILGIRPVNEVIAQAVSTKRLYPHIRTVIEVGGEDSKLIFLDERGIKDFSMNSICAAGTGSFIEQQAERLRLTIEEFSEIAAKARKPSRIAGRCSVFAKSDMIHLQQIATPLEDIVAGLCFAVARNFKGTIARASELIQPVAFHGGVALNRGVVRALREVFELDEIFIPQEVLYMGAIGAILKNMEELTQYIFNSDALEKLERLEKTENVYAAHRPLVLRDPVPARGKISEYLSGNGILNFAFPIDTYLGIDIGSISTNLAVIDEEGRLITKRYLMTAGRPIDAVKQGLEEIFNELGGRINIKAVGTTGSGRYMIADYVGADIVKNEITAQATAAINIDPEVDTIFEIGGQDSKYISIKDGVVIDFEMNKACAAGTGSFLEEQAEKLGISIKDQFAELAFCSKSPCSLGERCTVFMENSLMANLAKGAKKEDLIAGLAYSIVENYINRVVAGKTIGRKIFFQGGVAFNKAVVAAFESYLGKRIIVPPHHDVTGAIGMALIAREHAKKFPDFRTRFKGFDLTKRGYQVNSFQCNGCPNVCEINRVKLEGEEEYLFYGGRCEKYEIRKDGFSGVEDYLDKRKELLRETISENPTLSGPSLPVIGIPFIFFFQEQLPLWVTFLRTLGFPLKISSFTNRSIIDRGVEAVNTDTCFPVKAAHGHCLELADDGIDFLFIPSFKNLNPPGDEFERGLTCPFVQTIPYVLRASFGNKIPEILSPVVDLSRPEYFISELYKTFKRFDISRSEIKKSLSIATERQKKFQEALKSLGRKALENRKDDEIIIVIVGRAYNAFDSGMNLDIPRKLSRMGIKTISMDMLPIEDVKIKENWPNMYWRSGQRILRVARFIKETPGLYPLFIGNFSCGPDSFILKYFQKELSGKPFLHIEIDEHSADAGAITRCEAFIDSIIASRANEATERKYFYIYAPSVPSNLKRTVFIPRMSDHAFALKAAFENCGVDAEVLPESDQESISLGKKYVSGKECFPCLVTTGDMLKRALSPDFIPEKSAFFMPSGTGPCRFGQYNIFHRMVLHGIGLGDVPVFSPNQDRQFYRDLGIIGKDFTEKAWTGVVAYEILLKLLHETRPFEKNEGETEELYGLYLDKLYMALKSGDSYMGEILSMMKRDFDSIHKYNESRPLIGIIGEIFVRSHSFSNENLIKKIEGLGGWVWLAPVEEWIYYVNYISLKKAWARKEWSSVLEFMLKRFLQKKIEHRLHRPFKNMRTLSEPDTKVILKNAEPYIPETFEGEAILSVGKAIDLIKNGASGIINAMPFGCMPGTIVTAIMKAISKETGIPFISIPYDGTESQTSALLLEAFMQQVRER
ncbi:MAG: acyl-CoA dehydratase activase [Thermodesulfovibrionales bacterium]|nr:acyl-CoA dehydratase activase [Thermodesulfovibrionales bacterium]